MRAKVLILLVLVVVGSWAEGSQVAANTKNIRVKNEKKHKRGLLDLDQGYASPFAYSSFSSPSLYSTGIHTNTVITKEVPVPVPHPVAVPIEKHVPYPVIQKVAVPVDRPVAVPVPKPYTVEVPVDRPVPYPVHVPVVKHVPAPYTVPLAQSYSLPVVKHATYPYSQSYVIDKYPAYNNW